MSEPEAKKTMFGIKTPSPTNMTADERQDYDEVRQVAAELLDDPDLWMEIPHPQFGFQKPRMLIQTGGKQIVLDLLAAIKYGAFT